MKFTETELKGAFVVEMEPIEDPRGFFARTFCRNEFMEHGLISEIAQCNMSYNCKRGTLRGMHYQVSPKAEDKVILCIKGSILDVIIDLRDGSPTWGKWIGVELTAANRKMLFVPKGFAHGYQALEDDTAVLYHASEFYSPDHERGIRWDDPMFNISWAIAEPIVSDKDHAHKDYVK